MSRRGRRRRGRNATRARWARFLTVGAVLGVAGIGIVAIRSVEGAPADGPAPSDYTAPAERVRVEVLNRGGVSGLASSASRWLREVGFDVVDIGDSRPHDPEAPSVVIDRVGRVDLATAVAEALGIDNVLSEPDPNLYVDVSVLLGSEWKRPDVLEAATSEQPARAWWDPRGWVGR